MSTDQGGGDIGRTFIEHRDQLRDVAQKILGTRDSAEDATQEAYLKVVEIGASWPIRNPVSYCFQVVRHLALDRRRRGILESHMFANEAVGEHAPSMQGTPEQTAIRLQHLSMVWEVLASLPARTRRAFSLYRLNGLTQREVAARHGVSVTLVNFMIRDATEALKQCRLGVEAE